jgi:hypothetical protein
MAFPSVSAPHFVSGFPPIDILYTALRSIHTLVFLLELHVVLELYLGYSKLLGLISSPLLLNARMLIGLT